MAAENSKDKFDKNDKANDKVVVSQEELDALRSKAKERDEYCDKFVRAHAEFENAKKRMEKDRLELLRYANDGLISEFLPIADNLEMAEKYIKEAKDFKAVQEGVDMIHLQIQKFLKDIGLEKIRSVGEKFDPNIHEAVETADAKDKEENLVIEELKPGYKFNGKLLRPASVKIVKHGG